MKTTHLVLLRHGQSQWNLENRFTGWADPNLTELGYKEALQAGEKIKNLNLEFDAAYTSVLKRAIHTLWEVLKANDLEWLPVFRDYRLNERHYGALTGLNKKETADKYGEDQVFTWRRSYDTPPPLLDTDDKRHPSFDLRYKKLNKLALPGGESLKDCLNRFLPLWNETISKELKESKNLVIVAHGNSLRALMLELEKISPEEITKVELETGVPVHYELDPSSLAVLKKTIL